MSEKVPGADIKKVRVKDYKELLETVFNGTPLSMPQEKDGEQLPPQMKLRILRQLKKEGRLPEKHEQELLDLEQKETEKDKVPGRPTDEELKEKKPSTPPTAPSAEPSASPGKEDPAPVEPEKSEESSETPPEKPVSDVPSESETLSPSEESPSEESSESTQGPKEGTEQPSSSSPQDAPSEPEKTTESDSGS